MLDADGEGSSSMSASLPPQANTGAEAASDPSAATDLFYQMVQTSSGLTSQQIQVRQLQLEHELFYGPRL